MYLPCLNSVCRLRRRCCWPARSRLAGSPKTRCKLLHRHPQGTATSPAAQGFMVNNYSKPRSHFPNPIAPYQARHDCASEPEQYGAH